METMRLNYLGKSLVLEGNQFKPRRDEKPFILQSPKQEVRKENVTKLKKVGIYASTLGVSLIPNIIQAEEINPINPDMLNPQNVFNWSMKIALIGLGISTGATAVLLIASNLLKQLGGKKRRQHSKEWTTDILKGYVQCLVAIPVVFALYYLATTIFGQLNFSKNTFLNLP